MRRKAIGFIRVIRPVNGLMMSLAVLVGAWITLAEPVSPDMLFKVLLGALTAFTLSGASMAINDYCDYEIDKINEPHRPLPSGMIELRESLILAAVLIMVGLAAALYTNVYAALLALLSIIVSVAYAFRGKRTGLLGNFLVSSCVAVPFIYGGILVKNSLDPRILLFSLMAFFSNTGREVAKGIVDVTGDEARGMRTIAVVHGEMAAAITASVFFLSSVLLSLIPPLAGLVSAWFVPIVAAADIGFISSSVMLLRRPTRQNARRIKNIILIWMLLGLLAFLAGKQ